MSNISNILGAYAYIAMPFLEEMKAIEKGQKEHKERILAEWEESKQYPRKKKKEVRKRLRLEWNVANIDLFNYI
jgi:hypothetical protein